jgi:hypothetical protein
MNHRKHIIHEEIFTSVNLLPKYMRNGPGIINKVTYVVSAFFAPARYMVVKIACSYSEVFL